MYLQGKEINKQREVKIMMINDSVRTHNTNLILNAVKDFAEKVNIDVDFADAIYNYFCDYYYGHPTNVAKEYDVMMEMAEKRNLTFEDCEELFEKRK